MVTDRSEDARWEQIETERSIKRKDTTSKERKMV